MTKEPRRFALSLRKASTPAEDVLWQVLRGWGFQGLEFRRPVPLSTYTVEIDGRQHECYAAYDDRRFEEIERHGFVIIRFTNRDVMTDLESVLMRIAKAAQPSEPSFPHPWPLSRPGEGKEP